MIVLIDIGNSTVKWALLEHGIKQAQDGHDIEIYDNNFLNYNGEDHEQVIASLLKFWQKINMKPSRVLIASVGNNDFVEELEEAIWNEYEIESELLKSSRKYKDLKNNYIKPSQLGIDRWLNLIGAYELLLDQNHKQAFCIIDCGTAITLDMVDYKGNHLGGLIVPGINLMQMGLLEKTSQIKQHLNASSKINKKNKEQQKQLENKDNKFNKLFKDSVLANNTEHAVKGGIYYCVLASIERFIDDMASIVNDKFTIYLTGGDAEKIYSMLKADSLDKKSELVLDQDLIWLGMASLV